MEGTIESSQIRPSLKMTSGPPRGATLSQQTLTLTDEWRAAPPPPHPRHKSQAIEVMGKPPPLPRFIAHVMLLLHTDCPPPTPPTPLLPSCQVFVISGELCHQVLRQLLLCYYNY